MAKCSAMAGQQKLRRLYKQVRNSQGSITPRHKPCLLRAAGEEQQSSNDVADMYEHMKAYILRATVAIGSAISFSLAALIGPDSAAFAAIGVAAAAVYFEMLCAYVDGLSPGSHGVDVGGKLPAQAGALQLLSYIARNAAGGVATALNIRVLIPVSAAFACAALHFALGIGGIGVHTASLLAGFFAQKAATLLAMFAGPNNDDGSSL